MIPHPVNLPYNKKIEVNQTPISSFLDWWLWADLNRRHHDYESCALTT